MPSPFPGMDPYLEEPSLWPDLHLGMIAAMRAALNAQVPEGYAVYADRYVWLHEPDGDTRVRLGKPDVYLSERTEAVPGSRAEATLVVPTVVMLPVVRRQGNRYLRIIDRHSRRVVTVVELLSPTNKDPGEDRDAYLAKRNEYLATGTNLVEIDLLRAGGRLPLGEPPPPPADYYVLVCRAAELPRAGVWPFSVRDPLPTIPVPLNPEDAPVLLSLQPCLDRAYDEAAYSRELDYAVPPDPPLREPDATWARELLAHRTP
jgi:hypothetical protein